MINFLKYHTLHLIKATRYSLLGLKAAFMHETAFQQEVIVCVILFPFAFIVGHTATERILLLGSLFLVLIVELLNSALETIVNRISLATHHLSGRAKDLGSAAVFLAILNAAFIWLLLIF